MANIELLDQVIAKIQEELDHWDQSMWAVTTADENGLPCDCGTKFCLAGWVAVLTGAKIDWRRATDSNVFTATCVNYGDERISSYAQRKLGVDDLTAEKLFDASNNLDDIMMYRDSIANNDPLYCCR